MNANPFFKDQTLLDLEIKLNLVMHVIFQVVIFESAIDKTFDTEE